MNNNQRSLIISVADGNLSLAKRYVKLIVESDTSKANQQFVSSIKRKLESQMNFMELPSDIKEILIMDDGAVSFNESRYYLSERESKILEEVLKMYKAGQKLSDMGINYLNSLLLYGESGTGKTLFGRYLAYKLGLPFVYMNFSNAISSYLGSTGKNIQKAFEFVKKTECVFMLDEIDAIGMKRGKEDVGEMARVTIGLMQALDRVKQSTIIIGATNRIDLIDKALLRRFTISHEVVKFSESEIAGMITNFLNDVGIAYLQEDINQYCSLRLSQANSINDVVRAIAKSIQENCDFKLC